ncbi:MAG: CBS domain-containing protein [Tannerella sp.]|nr:CBS domain-containing protein [Tannerella sp.]
MEADDYFPTLLLQMTYDERIMSFVAAFVVLLLLLALTTVLSAAESAVASLSQDESDEIEESNSRIDRLLVFFTDYLRLTRASCRVFQSVLLSAITIIGVYATSMLCFSVPYILMYITAFVVITFIWMLFYGILPKLLFKNKLKTARITAPVLKMAVTLCKPFVFLTNFPVENPNDEPSKKSQALLNEAPNSIYEEKEMLEEIIHFYDKKASEIMTPRTDIQTIDIKSNMDDVIKIIIDSGYSRIPVYDEDEDDIKGILYVKDVIPALKDIENQKSFKWQSLLRSPYFVPESKKIEHLLGELRANRSHLAIVVDEFGCTAGLVTMEDIIEEIIGDISDEYDQDEDSYMALPDGSYIFEGKTQLNDFFRDTGVPPSDFGEHTEEAETLTGLMLAIKGTLPRRRDVVEYKNYKFRILEADERRVLKVKFSII